MAKSGDIYQDQIDSLKRQVQRLQDIQAENAQLRALLKQRAVPDDYLPNGPLADLLDGPIC